jgi:hypothetical protein
MYIAWEIIVTILGSCDYRRCIDWMIGFIGLTHHKELQVIKTLSLISTLYSSLHRPLRFLQHAVSWPVVPKQRLLAVKILSFASSGPLVTAARAELLSIHCQLPAVLLPSLLSCLPSQETLNYISSGLDTLYITSGRIHQTTPLPNNSSIFTEVCLPRRCTEYAVLLLLHACSFPQWPVYRVVAY